MTKQRLIRHGQSQRTGTIIDSEVINKWIEKETGEDGVLKGYAKIEQEYAGSKDNATQGAFAVDDIKNSTRYFIVANLHARWLVWKLIQTTIQLVLLMFIKNTATRNTCAVNVKLQ